MAETVLLYGVVIRQAIATGDKGLMSSLQKVSDYLLKQQPRGADVADWRTADAELHKALGN